MSVDRLWHGELFLISENVAEDLSLGVVITATVFAFWGIIIALSKMSSRLARYLATPESSSQALSRLGERGL